MQQQVPHPFWQCYVTVADVDAAAAKAAELGGTVAMPPMAVFDAGRMASVIDPTGAAINLWQKGTHGGADIIGEPCAFAWAELYTPDREKAGQFYTQLLGWTIEESSLGSGGAYHVFLSNGANAAGMPPVQPEELGIPPNWSPYFAVADCDETVARAESLGGKLDFPPMEIPEIGRFTFLQDPQGAHFAIIQFGALFLSWRSPARGAEVGGDGPFGVGCAKPKEALPCKRKDGARAALERVRERLIGVSHTLHGHPEVAYEEERSAEVLSEAFSDAGFGVERGVAGLADSVYGNARLRAPQDRHLRRVRRAAGHRPRLRAQHHRSIVARRRDCARRGGRRYRHHRHRPWHAGGGSTSSPAAR